MKPHTKFEGEIYCLNKDEGGRHTPFLKNYKPQFFFRTADITGAHETTHTLVPSFTLMLQATQSKARASVLTYDSLAVRAVTRLPPPAWLL